jgi:hypothetical protein
MMIFGGLKKPHMFSQILKHCTSQMPLFFIWPTDDTLPFGTVIAGHGLFLSRDSNKVACHCGASSGLP